MGMRVGSSGGASATQSSAWQERKQNMDALAKALQSNDIDAAKAAYATLTKNAPQGATQGESPMAKIGQALSSGDLSGAQQAMSAMRSGHHHHAENGSSSAESGTSSGSSAMPSWTSATIGNNLNAVA